MITSAKQLKDKIKNLSGGNGTKAQTLLRNFIMERFLERIYRADTRDSFRRFKKRSNEERLEHIRRKKLFCFGYEMGDYL